jgi:RNA polymerase sigma factor for flagellar operon FliA
VARPRPDADAALALWRDYDRTRDRALRDRLVLTFAPLAKHVAYRKLREMPAQVDVEDLIAAGLEALVVAIERYDPRKGASLEQYAWTRIHGAVLDELRRQDWAPRSVRRRQRELDRAVEDFTAIHGRAPGERETADAAGLTVDALRRHRGDVARSGVASLNISVLSEDDTPIERVETIADEDAGRDPERAAAARDASDRFRAAFSGLPPREQTVAILLYVQGLTLAEIGQVLGVSESRVCQLHTTLKGRLREQLEEDAALFAPA